MNSAIQTLDRPVVAHTVWCDAHEDAGHLDQECRSKDWALTPAAHLPGDPCRVHATLSRRADRPGGSRDWRTAPPTVLLEVEHLNDRGDRVQLAGPDLTLDEARALIVKLSSLVETAELERVAR